jgi:ABC-type transport system involved in cytochrome bd biosynthesis fused ATPase/permease subunit
MLALLLVEAALAGLTTWLVIKAGQDLANEDFLIGDFGWIVLAQSASYGVGAISWIFAERAGFGAFGRYMLRFAKDNKHQATLFADKYQREHAEPFLTNETFHIFFELIFEIEADLKLFFSLIFNTAVLGFAIDAGLPMVYALVFVMLLVLQYAVRNWVSTAYLNNQRATNRMTAHTYTAWDNITSGNRYNFRLWSVGFKRKLRDALAAQIKSIMAREGIAAISGIFALALVFSYLAYVAALDAANTAMLIALAATLPRQIELSQSLHGLASGWNDLQAVWTRIGGACNAMHPQADAAFDNRIQFSRLSLVEVPASGIAAHGHSMACQSADEVVAHLRVHTRGVIQVRGSNGSGKSSLLAALKSRLGSQAFYWPTSDKLAFAFATGVQEPQDEDDDAVDVSTPVTNASNNGFSSGERQIKSLEEIANRTDAQVYLLDEWDANLDTINRARAQAIVQTLAQRAVVVEISHRA